MQDSNLRHIAYKAIVLPTELIRQKNGDDRTWTYNAEATNLQSAAIPILLTSPYLFLLKIRILSGYLDAFTEFHCDWEVTHLFAL